MELWQLDVVHGFALADGTAAKALTGIDDHSRFCVSACLMAREPTQAVCDGFSSAMRKYGVPAQVLTDNGKVFTGRFAQPPVEVLFDRICRKTASTTSSQRRARRPPPARLSAFTAPSVKTSILGRCSGI